MRSAILIEIVSIVDKTLVSLTNQAYSRNYKFSYKIEWLRGTHEIEVEGLGKTKNYYVLCLYLIDKNESPVGKRVNLYTCYYPLEKLVTPEKLEEMAYKEILSNGLASLINNVYASLLSQLQKEVVKPEDVNLAIEELKEEAKPKLIIK